MHRQRCLQRRIFSKKNIHRTTKNNATNFLAVYVDGRQVPAKPLQPNFETDSYIWSYINLFSTTGKHAQDEGNEISRVYFGQGYTLFGFDLTPDGCDGGCIHLTRKCNLRIEMHFATALEQTVNLVVYGEFKAVLEIDKGRNIIYNYWWRPTVYHDFWHGTRWSVITKWSLKTLCSKSSLRTHPLSCASHTTATNLGNIRSPCAWMRSVTTSTHTDKSRNTPSSRTLWTNITRSGRPTIIFSRALYLPFVVNTASLS